MVRVHLNLLLLLSISFLIVLSLYSLYNFHPVYSLCIAVIFLLFFCGLLIYLNLSFIAIIVSLIYIGAIFILFFFLNLLTNSQVLLRNNLHKIKVPICILLIIISFVYPIYQLKQLGLGLLVINNNSNSTILNLETAPIILFEDNFLLILILILILLLGLLCPIITLINTNQLKLVQRESS